MRTRTRNPFTTVTTAGLLLPVDLLVRIAEGDSELKGLDPKKDYHLRADRLNEATSKAWNECQAAWKSFRRKFQALPASDTGTTVTRDEWLLPLFEELDYGRLQTKPKLVIDDKEYPVSHGWENHVPIHLISARYPLDRRTPGVAGAATRSPYSMTQELLNRSAQHRWGMVSNGLKLFLLCDNLSLARAANVEFDLEAMMEGEVYADFQLLFLLCHQSRVELLEAERKPTATEKKAAKAKGKKRTKLIEDEAGDEEEVADSEEAPAESAPTKECWLDRWSKQAEQTGVQAREQLRFGVENAIQALGAGFLETRGNNALRDRLRTGTLRKEDYYRQLLRLVYRLIMTLVAEEKKTEDGSNLLHPPGTPTAVRLRYARYYSVSRLRTLAQSRRGTAHPDLYESLKVLFEKLRTGHAALGIPALGSFLFSPTSMPELDSARLSNEALLNCIRSLCVTKDGSARGGGMDRPVDFGNLGAEELGSVYESLLELHPLIDTDAGPFSLSTAAGNERKTTGSYYTPTSLINCLLDSALDPVVHEAIDKPDRKEAEKALLNLKVCDPACGSGHFLIAAAERMAKHLARLRTEDDEPSTLAIQHARRDIIGRCIYGVDLNPMAVELCKVSLWMEALEPGKPLSFLDHHIQCGNSLLGTTPMLLATGIPDDAFTAIEGDVKSRVSDLKKQNKRERQEYASGQGYLFEPYFKLGNMAADFARLNTAADDTVEAVAAIQDRYAELVRGSGYQFGRLLADTWCAAFVWKKDDSDLGKMCPTERDFRKVESHAAAGLLPQVRAEVEHLRDRYQFFHWHLAYPDVFRLPGKYEAPENEQTGWSDGFDVVLGNPPWEQSEIEETAWFSNSRPEISVAPNDVERKSLIRELQTLDPALHAAFVDAKRVYDGVAHLASNGKRFPLCGRGRMNTASLFAELNRDLIGQFGAIGCIVPTGIATDDTTKHFFNDLLSKHSLKSLFGFHNGEGLFPSVRPHQQFCLLTLRTSETGVGEFAFGLSNTEELRDAQKRYELRRQDIAMVNPNTQTCPVFTSRRDLGLTIAMYSRVPVLIRETSALANPWSASFKQGLFNMASDSKCFRTRQQLEAEGGTIAGARYLLGEQYYVPLFDAKMAQQFNHRAADLGLSGHQFRKISKNQTSVEQLTNPCFTATSVYWVPLEDVNARLNNWPFQWLLGFKDITGTTSTALGVFAIISRVGVGHPFPLLFAAGGAADHAILAGNFNALVIEYILRSKLQGLHLTFYYVKQLPVLPPDTYSQRCLWAGDLQPTTTYQHFLVTRLLELTYTAWDLEPFARDCGYAGPPFRWDVTRRFLLRAELDAAFFHLYLPADKQGEWLVARTTDGCPYDETSEQAAALHRDFPTPRDAVEYILETFAIVKKKDIAKHGDYRTKLVILDIYDRMQQAMATGEPYQTLLDPPPADPRVAHPPKA